MTISDSTRNKHFGSNLIAKDITISLITSAIGNDYNSSILHGTEVDTVNFEIRCTDIAATIIEIINLYLKSFKLSLTMEEPITINEVLKGSYES